MHPAQTVTYTTSWVDKTPQSPNHRHTHTNPNHNTNPTTTKGEEIQDLPNMVDSNTLLMYTNNDPMQPANYRPIRLNNTMGKLCSGMAASVLNSYAENTHIRSESQHGCRAQRSYQHALNNLAHTIEDAAIYKHDLYVAYFDFTPAFNMVDHDTLLCIMHDLGFPEDAVDAVKSIYNGATTHISIK